MSATANSSPWLLFLLHFFIWFLQNHPRRHLRPTFPGNHKNMGEKCRMKSNSSLALLYINAGRSEEGGGGAKELMYLACALLRIFKNNVSRLNSHRLRHSVKCFFILVTRMLINKNCVLRLHFHVSRITPEYKAINETPEKICVCRNWLVPRVVLQHAWTSAYSSTLQWTVAHLHDQAWRKISTLFP